MNKNEQQYLDLLQELVDLADIGNVRGDRTGTGTYSVFGRMLRFDLRDGTIPLLTTKRVHVHSIIVENLWFLQGSGNIKFLLDNGVTIWDEWATNGGELGPVYGVQWRNWLGSDGKTYDQVKAAVHELKTNPTSRRILVTGLNPSLLPDPHIDPKKNVQYGKQALPPCHYTFQLYARELSTSERFALATEEGQKQILQLTAEESTPMDTSVLEMMLDEHSIPKHELSLKLDQRSCDIFLGGAFNIASYAIFVRMFCEVTNMVPGDLVWSLGDCHLYTNHVEQAKLQLSRSSFPSPTLSFARQIDDIDDFKLEDFIIDDYQHHPGIKAPVAV